MARSGGEICKVDECGGRVAAVRHGFVAIDGNRGGQQGLSVDLMMLARLWIDVSIGDEGWERKRLRDVCVVA